MSIRYDSYAHDFLKIVNGIDKKQLLALLNAIYKAVKDDSRIFFMGRPIYRIEHMIEDLYIGIPKRTNYRLKPRAYGLCLEASGTTASLNDFKTTEQRFFEDIERYRPSKKDVVIAVDDGIGDISAIISGAKSIEKKYKTITFFIGRQKVLKNGNNIVFRTNKYVTQGDNILSVIDHIIMTSLVFNKDILFKNLIPDYLTILEHVMAKTIIRESAFKEEIRGNIYLIGNGGSAAMCSSAGYILNKAHVPASALTNERQIVNTSSTREEYEQVFVSQLDGICKNDMLVGISTSGNSNNVLKGMIRAKDKGARLIGLTAFDGGKIYNKFRNETIVIPVTCYGLKNKRVVLEDSDTSDRKMYDYAHGEDIQNLILMYFVQNRIGNKSNSAR